jgi:hypothetical protein
MVLETREIFYVGEYILDLSDMVGVCTHYPAPVVGPQSAMTDILENITTALNTVSTIGLTILLVIYLLLPSLRTLQDSIP